MKNTDCNIPFYNRIRESEIGKFSHWFLFLSNDWLYPEIE
ncbi:hypothetical protein LEP1GSC074_1560 [Leptospira noguchii str. Hook]|uniref:Uncharacterized protein n=2 Tax=Leptospira noguchii TaxID=28182 RepID=M6UEQ6_9LEPT|nr:hypothetical protein LEP1GSC041_4472 [Leptospira noguchii str. 2006001870]EMO43005.1 hypothetical protein LEP1GSC186_2671 [Leptospira noguchii serovar Autumnalis str. ZUN142]EMO53418.1 hypothetical protein LEP1GSC172_1982 [Leptospira noguchii]EMS84171.1 hypothetical protein LEP1GSC074_1560 [Leptospira noguchii str. Hook]